MGKKKGKGKKMNSAENEKTLKRMELSLELEMGDMNARLFRQAWRERMKRMNLPLVKENLETAWKIFDRAIDSKNYSISILLDGLDMSKEQKRRSDNLHLDTINKLLETYMKIVNNAELKYKEAVDEAVKEADELEDFMQKQQDEKELLLQTTSFATKQAYDQSAEALQTKYWSKLDTRKEICNNDLRMAQELLKRRIRTLLEQNAKILQDHDESSQEKRKEYELLKLRHDEDQRIISQQSRKIEKLFNTVQDIKKMTLDFREKSQKELEDYKFERDYFYEAYIYFQKRVLAEQTYDKEQLKTTTMIYKQVEEYLEERLDKVEKILILVSLCDKYVTFDDKLLIFPISIPVDNTICQEINKLNQVISSVQQDVTNLKILYKKSVEEYSFLQQNIRAYLERVTYGLKEKECNEITSVKPRVISLKSVIRY